MSRRNRKSVNPLGLANPYEEIDRLKAQGNAQQGNLAALQDASQLGAAQQASTVLENGLYVSSASAVSIQPDPFVVPDPSITGPHSAECTCAFCREDVPGIEQCADDGWESVERVCFSQFIRAPFQSGQADVYDELGGWIIARRGDTFRLTWKLSGKAFFTNVRAAWF